MASETVGGGGGPVSSEKLKLYSDWLSSSSGRVRIGLNLKGLEYEYKAVNLLKGDQHSPEFLKLNPVGFVPVLVDGDIVIIDSFAILMYLEEKFPQRPLLPMDLHKRAINYQAASIVCSGIQPYQNLLPMKIIRDKLGPGEDVAWARDHIRRGLSALEKLLKDHAGKYATGDEVFLADLFLAPQIDDSIRRFQFDMNEFPLLLRITRHMQRYLLSTTPWVKGNLIHQLSVETENQPFRRRNVFLRNCLRDVPSVGLYNKRVFLLKGIGGRVCNAA